MRAKKMIMVNKNTIPMKIQYLPNLDTLEFGRHFQIKKSKCIGMQ